MLFWRKKKIRVIVGELGTGENHGSGVMARGDKVAIPLPHSTRKLQVAFLSGRKIGGKPRLDTVVILVKREGK